MVSKNAEAAKLFQFVAHKAKHNMRKCFEQVGITMPQGMVMGVLIHCGEVKVSEISKKLGLSNSTVSGIIDRLEKRNIVERVRNIEDKRVVMIKITDNFLIGQENFIKLSEKNFEKLLENGTPEEIDKIIEGLEVLKKILEYEE